MIVCLHCFRTVQDVLLDSRILEMHVYMRCKYLTEDSDLDDHTV